MNYGYARVSTITQNLDRQLDNLLKLNIRLSNIYSDKESGKDFNRKNYKKLCRKLKFGDVLFIKSIDRLGRNYNMILEEWRYLTKEKGVAIVVLDMPLLDTRENEKNLIRKFIADVVLQILSFVAENERAAMKQRQKEGIKIAKEKGIKFGRPAVETPKNFYEVAKKYKQRKINSSQACALTGLSRGTFFRKLNKMF